MIELYKIIRKYRTSANLTQADIAEACGVTRNAVTQWESVNGKTRTEPSINDLEKIAQLCHVSIVDMLSPYDVQEQGPLYSIENNSFLQQREKILISDFRSLEARDKDFLLLTLRNLKEKESNT